MISKKTAGEELLSKYCVHSEKALLRQADHDPERLQKDGWGLAFYGKKGLEIFKSRRQVFLEKDLLERKLSSAGGSRIFIAHIRDASNPRGLPRKDLIAEKNSQPFAAGDLSFAHNGTLFIVDEILYNLGRYRKFVRGVNDSEVLFWTFMKMLDAYGDAQAALEMTRDEINTVWISVKKDYGRKGVKSPYRGLNLFVSDGRELHALCDYRPGKRKDSIMTPGWDWGDYAVRREGDSLIIASEPLDRGAWSRVGSGSLLKLSAAGKLSIKTRILQ